MLSILKKILVIAILSLLLASSFFASISTLQMNAKAQTSSSATSNLNQYDWPQFQGDESFTRFSAGPAPNMPSILWKANVPGIQPDLTAFDGLIFVGTNTSLVAVNQAGQIAWSTPIPLNKTWPIAYEIDSSHLVAEGSCLDPSTGKILWTSTSFLRRHRNLHLQRLQPRNKNVLRKSQLIHHRLELC